MKREREVRSGRMREMRIGGRRELRVERRRWLRSVRILTGLPGKTSRALWANR